jgi:hypothetical protein
MNCKEKLEIAANIAAIVTAIVTASVSSWLWVRFKCDRYQKKKELEKYLNDVRQKAKIDNTQGARSAIIISRDTGLTESEIWEICAKNPRINKLAKINRETNLGEEILFQYNDTISN